MTGVWLIFWFASNQPDVHGGWVVLLVIAAIWDLVL